MAGEKTGESTWGCPGCGGTDIIQHVTICATRDGKFRDMHGSWTFDGDDDVARDSLDITDEGEFECQDCGETFEKPVRIRKEPGIRLVIQVMGSAYKPDENGIESEVDADLSTRFETICKDKEMAGQLFNMLKLFIKSSLDTVRNS